MIKSHTRDFKSTAPYLGNASSRVFKLIEVFSRILTQSSGINSLFLSQKRCAKRIKVKATTVAFSDCRAQKIEELFVSTNTDIDQFNMNQLCQQKTRTMNMTIFVVSSH